MTPRERFNRINKIRIPTTIKRFISKKEYAQAKKELKKFVKKKKNRRFIYYPDIYAILFGEMALKRNIKKLLRKGRVFTSLEGRGLI